jgi:hypothetical protein
VKALEQGDPNLVQRMSAPMLSHLAAQDRPIIPLLDRREITSHMVPGDAR